MEHKNNCSPETILQGILKFNLKKRDQSITEVLLNDKHKLFHLFEEQHCCGCTEKTKSQNKKNIQISRAHWDKLFISKSGKCSTGRSKKGLCCCNYDVNPHLEVDSLDPSLTSILLMCLFQLSKKDMVHIQSLMLKAEMLDVKREYEHLFGNSSRLDEFKKYLERMKDYASEDIVKQILLPVSNMISASQKSFSQRLQIVEDKVQKAGEINFFKRHFEDNPGSSGTTPKRQRKDIYDIRSLYYSNGNFPRFSYKQELLKQCADRFSIVQSVHDEVDFLSCKTLKIDVLGDITRCNLRLISKRKALKYQHDKVWSSNVLVYFLDDSLSTKSILEEMFDFVYKDVIIVGNDSVLFHDGENHYECPRLHFVKYEKVCIRETITKCLENRLADCVEKLQMKLETIRPSRRNARSLEKLALEVSALSCLINETVKAQGLTTEAKDKLETKTSCVPTQIKNFLLKREDVHSFGIWRGGSFKVFVGENENTIEMKTELNKRFKLFFEKYELNVEILSQNEMNFGKCPYIGQGDKLFETNEENRYGTLGGIVRNSVRPEQIFAMTCSHVYPEEGKSAFAKLTSNRKPEKIGTCYFSQSTGPTFCDFALIKIDERFQKTCATILTDEVGKECNGIIFEDKIPEKLFVHKKGATTAWTAGLILSPEFYLKEFGGRQEVFLVSNIKESPFSKPGDSGSIVFFHDNTATQSSLNILGMIWAGEPSLKDENEEKGACGSSPLENKGEKRHSLKDASICFRIDKAFQILSEEKDMIVKFDKALSSSSSNGTDESDDEITIVKSVAKA